MTPEQVAEAQRRTREWTPTPGNQWPRAPLAEEGGHGVVPETGAGSEGHELLSLLTELVYAQAVNGSTLRHRSAPRTLTHAFSEGLSCPTAPGARGGLAGLEDSRGVRALSGALARWTGATLSRCHGQQPRRKPFPERAPEVVARAGHRRDVAGRPGRETRRVRRSYTPAPARRARAPECPSCDSRCLTNASFPPRDQILFQVVSSAELERIKRKALGDQPVGEPLSVGLANFMADADTPPSSATSGSTHRPRPGS